MLFGIDISEYQRGIDLVQVKREGYEFCVVKATEGPYADGSCYLNPSYQEQIQAAAAAGLVVGAYHFLVETPAVPQVDLFLNTIGETAGKLIMVDFEAYNAPYDYLSPSNGTLQTFLAALRTRSSRAAILVYSSRGFWNGGTPSGPLGDYGQDLVAWDAFYPSMDPVSPAAYYPEIEYEGWGKPWGDVRPKFWQFTPAGQVAGMEIDVNAFGGTLEELYAFAGYQETKHEEDKAVAYKEIPVEITPERWVIKKGTSKDPEYIRARDIDAHIYKTDDAGWLYLEQAVRVRGTPSAATSRAGGDTIAEDTNSYKAIRYLEQLVGYMPYWVWESGPVPDGEGAYAVNAPPPPVPELRGQRIFCAGVPNLCRRIAGKTIPTRGNELYDGGVAAYFDSPTINELTGTRGFWASYGLEEAFDLDTAKQWAYDTRSMVLIGRDYTGGDGDTVDLASQGHVAILLPSGYVLQSFQSDASGWPGLNWAYTIEESHDGGYYTKMVHPGNWLEF